MHAPRIRARLASVGWLEDPAMAIYAFDVDESLEVSKSLLKLVDLVNLREHGHIVGLCTGIGRW